VYLTLVITVTLARLRISCCRHYVKVQATVIKIVKYERNTFILKISCSSFKEFNLTESFVS